MAFEILVFSSSTKYSLQPSKSFNWILCPIQEEEFTFKAHVRKSSLNKIAKKFMACLRQRVEIGSLGPDTDVWEVTHSPIINFITENDINVTNVMFFFPHILSQSFLSTRVNISTIAPFVSTSNRMRCFIFCIEFGSCFPILSILFKINHNLPTSLHLWPYSHCYHNIFQVL